MKPGSTPLLERQPALPTMGRPDWWTPDWLFDELNAKYGPFTLDAAASPDNAKCVEYFTEEQDGRAQPWTGRVFCNPPYRDLVKWVEHAYHETQSGRCELACLLLPAQTSTRWFHEFALPFAELQWIRGKVKFAGQKDRALMPTVIVVFRRPESA